jgi:pimeloyl-ACP methyl ester carboxylesterase
MKRHISAFRVALLATLFIASGTVTIMGQRLKPGPQDLSFFSTVDETDQPYAIYIPKNFDESREYPLVVFLHGAWSNHRLGLRRAFGQGNLQGLDFIKPGNVQVESDLEATRYFTALKDVDCIVAAPLARGTAGYQGIPEQDVYDMITDIESRFKIDKNRLYLTGLSMGGGGTIWLALTHPDMWAAIAPCCPAPPDESLEISGNVFNLPVHLFTGDKDFLFPTAQVWKKKFEADSKLFNYVEYPGVGHNSWEYAYKDGFIFEWFSQFVRDPYPSEVKFTSKWYKYNKAYWVRLDELTPGTLAVIDAKFTGQNSIEVTSSGLDAFTLNLEGHPMFNPSQKVSVKVDGKVFSGKSADAFSFTRLANGWTNTRFTPGLTSKQARAEGPVSEAVAGNHIYVYGTGGNPTQQELYNRMTQASSAADWSGMGGRIMVFPRVLSDRDLRQSDYDNSNLVLFGTRETNAIIEKYADRLPFHLNVSAANDYGLLYIFPLNKHYVLVNSGLPWWTSPKKAPGQGMAFMGSKIDGLKNFRDFILFKGSPDNIVSQGLFDNNWKLPAAAADAMKASGIINLN